MRPMTAHRVVAVKMITVALNVRPKRVTSLTLTVSAMTTVVTAMSVIAMSVVKAIIVAIAKVVLKNAPTHAMTGKNKTTKLVLVKNHVSLS